MFIGRSPEEAELAGEESGSWLDSLREAVSPIVSRVVSPLMPAAKQAYELTQTPAGKAALTYFAPQASIALSLAQGAKGAAQPQQPQPAKTASAGWGTPGRRTLVVPRASRHDHVLGCAMGADPPMTENQILAMIKRERHPVKRERMLMNFMRSQGRI